MAEVYTISGSQLGKLPTQEEIQQKIFQAGQIYGRVQQQQGAPAKASPVARLQNALRALGATKGDPTLSKLKVDGVVGSGTTKAVNYAIAQHYVVMPSFPRPELTVQHVRQYASGIAAAIESAVMAGGGTLAPIRAAAARSHGGGATAALPADAMAPSDGSDHKWIWWVVGGVSVLVVLGIAASAVRGRGRGESPSSRRRREAEEER